MSAPCNIPFNGKIYTLQEFDELSKKGNRLTVDMSQPAARPIQNAVAQQIATLSTNLKTGSVWRQSLRGQPASVIVAELQTQLAPIAQALLRSGRRSESASRLVKNRGQNIPAFFDAATGQFDNGWLMQLADYISKRKKPSPRSDVEKLRRLIWSNAGDDKRPLLLKEYTDMLSSKSYIDENGNYAVFDEQADAQDIEQATQILSGQGDNWATRTLKKALNFKWVSAVMTPQVVAKMMSVSPDASIRRILGPIRQAWQERRDEVALRRNVVIAEAEKLFSGLSYFNTRGQNERIQRLNIKGYIDGKQTDIEASVDDLIDLYMTAKTQLLHTEKVTGKVGGISAIIADDTPTPNRGYVYESVDKTVKQNWLLTRDQFTQLETLLRQQFSEQIKILEKYYSDETAKGYVSQLYVIENKEDFPEVDYYYPTQVYRSKASSSNVTDTTRLLESVRILRERSLPSLQVQGMSALNRMRQYERLEGQYIGNSAVRLGITAWKKANEQALVNMPDALLNYLSDLEVDLNDPNKRFRPEQDAMSLSVRGVDVSLSAWQRRFSRATFSWKLTSPLINATTFVNGYAVGVVSNKSLNRAASTMGLLLMDSYRIARFDAGKDILGFGLAENKFLNRIAANPFARSLYYRAVGPTDAALGNPTIEDIKSAPIDAGIAKARKGVKELGAYGIRYQTAADRAVIISFYEAARMDVEEKLSKGELFDEAGNVVTDMGSDVALKEVARLATELVSATNTLSGEGNMTGAQRNKSMVGQLIGLYTGQSQKLFSTTMSTLIDYLQLKADPSATPEELKKALTRATMSAANLMLFSSVSVALINKVWATLWGKDDDDTLEEWGTSLAIDSGRNLIGSVPSLPTAALLSTMSMLDDKPWEDSVIDYAPQMGLTNTVKGLYAGATSFSAENDAAEQRKLDSFYTNTLDGVGKLVGIGTSLPKEILKRNIRMRKEAEKSGFEVE